MIPPSTPKPVNAFHAHLDACSQCATSPFSLCPIGRLLLDQAVTKIRNDVGKILDGTYKEGTKP